MTNEARSIRKRLRWTVAIIFALPFVYALGDGVLWNAEYREFSRLGSVQVLAGPKEMWIFFQVDHCVTRTCRLCSHPSRTVGHFQQVLMIDDVGHVERVKIPLETGITFHPNLSTIYRVGDPVYLCEDESATFRRSLFQWSGEKFELLPLAESESLLASLPKDEEGNRVDWDRFFRESEWKQPVAESYLLDDVSFDWNNRRYTIEFMEGSATTRAQLKCDSTKQEWATLICEVDNTFRAIDRREFQRLTDSPRQERHQK